MRRKHALWDLERRNNRNAKFSAAQHPVDTAPEKTVRLVGQPWWCIITKAFLTITHEFLGMWVMLNLS